MKSFVYKIILPLVCTMSLVGCGGEKAENATNNATNNDAGVKKTSAETNSNADTPDNTLPKDAMVIKVAMTANYAPYGFLDEYGKPTGYNIDFIRAIGKEEGFKAEFVVVPWLKFADSLMSGETDVGFSTGTVGTAEQKTKFLLSDSYLRNAIGYGVQSDSLDVNKEDLEGKVIAVQKNTKYVSLLKENQPTAQALEADSSYLAYSYVMTGKAAAILNDESLIMYQASMFPEHPIRFLPMESAGDTDHYALSASDNKEEIIGKINDGFQKIKANGKYSEINKKWFGDKAEQLAVN